MTTDRLWRSHHKHYVPSTANKHAALARQGSPSTFTVTRYTNTFKKKKGGREGGNLVAFSQLNTNLDSTLIVKFHFSVCQNYFGRYNHEEKWVHSLETVCGVSVYKMTTNCHDFFEVKVTINKNFPTKTLNTLLFGMFNAGEIKLTPYLILYLFNYYCCFKRHQK